MPTLRVVKLHSNVKLHVRTLHEKRFRCNIKRIWKIFPHTQKKVYVLFCFTFSYSSLQKNRERYNKYYYYECVQTKEHVKYEMSSIILI